MTLLSLALSGARHHVRAHAGLLAGSALATAVLVGALVLGGSVRESLLRLALERLGRVQHALAGGDRFFRERLAEDFSRAVNTNAEAAPVLALTGIAAMADGSARANHVQVLGVKDSFWRLAGSAPATQSLTPGTVWLNASLAAQLRARPGDTVLLRVPKPSLLSRDAPIAPQEDASTAARLTVAAVVEGPQGGNFNLQASQMPPFNAFVPLSYLQEQAGVTNQANLLLASEPAAPGGAGAASNALSTAWQLADGQLSLRTLPGLGVHELRSGRVFLDAPVSRAALEAGPGAQGVMTYFVNELRLGSNAAPYSIVAALNQPPGAADLKKDEIVINDWLAQDLGARAGDELAVKYFVVGALRNLEERTARFRVRAIVPMEGVAADRDLMPDFPGLAHADSCRDWDAGFPIALDTIRPKDQQYWDDHRGTPKAFITLEVGRALWTSRFGDLTAVRYPASIPLETLEKALRERLRPEALGLQFQPVRDQALAAAGQGQDFGQLFLGMSFFLIGAAVMLTVMFFQFSVEQRAAEMGALLALGLRPGKVRWLFLAEAGAVAVLGGLAGVLGGLLYARGLIHALTTVWVGAVNTTAIEFHASAGALAIGFGSSLAVSLGALWLALRKQARRSPHVLLAAGGELEAMPESAAVQSWRGRWHWLMFALGLGLVGWGLARPQAAAGAFFGAGACLLIALFRSAALGLRRWDQSRLARAFTLSGLGLRNLARRPRRSLTAMMLLACGTFLIVAVNSNRLDAQRDATQRSSGTGGFAWLGETALPIYHDLNSAEGRAFLGLDATGLTNLAVTPLRVREGDEASCLNLNRAQTPRLLGVDPARLTGRFTFAQRLTASPADPWAMLLEPQADGAVPAVGDQASILWAMGKSVGDTLDYVNEHGEVLRVRIVGAVANSILQGSLLIAERDFIKAFPSEGGCRMFLLDAPSPTDALAGELTRALRDYGLELTPTTTRLAAFNRVQNTYLSTFQVLGGLGLLLGSAGLAVVLLRNVLERRGELALLLAVGFKPADLRAMLLAEHACLLVAGLLAGAFCALVAVLPSLLTPGGPFPWQSLALTLGAILAGGLIWTWLAARVALRGDLLDAIKSNP